MSDLNCNAKNCRYNCGGLCGLDSIEIYGDDAKTSDGTCCGNFTSDDSDFYGFSASLDPRGETSIDCEACKCEHNEDGCCCLDNVSIDGDQAACCGDTCCKSFKRGK